MLRFAKQSNTAEPEDTFSLSLTSNEESTNLKASDLKSSGILKAGNKGFTKSVTFQSPITSVCGSDGPDTKRLQSAISEVSTGISSGSEQHAKSLGDTPTTLKKSTSETLKTMSILDNVIVEKPEMEKSGSVNTMSLLNSKPLKENL